MKHVSCFALAALLLSALPAMAAESGSAVYGADMPEGEAQSIAAAIDGYVQEVSEPRKFFGRVASVCRKKGCWMELEAEGRSARVTMLDYGFFLPTDAAGGALVYGTLSEVELDRKTAEHYAEDAGKNASEADTTEFQIVAHSVLLTANQE